MIFFSLVLEPGSPRQTVVLVDRLIAARESVRGTHRRAHRCSSLDMGFKPGFFRSSTRSAMEVTFRTHLPGGPGFHNVSTVFTDAVKGMYLALGAKCVRYIGLTWTHRLATGGIIIF